MSLNVLKASCNAIHKLHSGYDLLSRFWTTATVKYTSGALVAGRLVAYELIAV